MNYKAIVHPDEDGGYWAEVPELPGLVTEGDTLDELYANLQEAVQGWLEADAKRKKSKGEQAVSGSVRLLEFAA